MSESKPSVVLIELESGSTVSNVMASTDNLIVGSTIKDAPITDIIIHTIDTGSEGIEYLIDAVVERAGQGVRMTPESVQKAQEEAATEE